MTCMHGVGSHAPQAKHLDPYTTYSTHRCKGGGCCSQGLGRAIVQLSHPRLHITTTQRQQIATPCLVELLPLLGRCASPQMRLKLGPRMRIAQGAQLRGEPVLVQAQDTAVQADDEGCALCCGGFGCSGRHGWDQRLVNAAVVLASLFLSPSVSLSLSLCKLLLADEPFSLSQSFH
eukprot:1148931-Pelagomonas_calceolata.AAC.2